MPVLPAQHRREREARGIAVARDELERRASGIAQAEQARALVERLARSVVTRAAEPQRCRVVGDVQHERVPTRRQQAGERRGEAERREPQCRHVPEQVVDGDERQAAAVGQGLGGREPDEQCADQSRSLRDRHGIEIAQRRPRVGERGLDDGDDELEVAPRRDLGHDAAEARVQVGLRRADRRPHVAVPRHDRRAGVVARGLDGEDHRPERPLGGSRHMISASSRLSV